MHFSRVVERRVQGRRSDVTDAPTDGLGYVLSKDRRTCTSRVETSRALKSGVGSVGGRGGRKDDVNEARVRGRRREHLKPQPPLWPLPSPPPPAVHQTSCHTSTHVNQGSKVPERDKSMEAGWTRV